MRVVYLFWYARKIQDRVQSTTRCCFMYSSNPTQQTSPLGRAAVYAATKAGFSPALAFCVGPHGVPVELKWVSFIFIGIQLHRKLADHTIHFKLKVVVTGVAPVICSVGWHEAAQVVFDGFDIKGGQGILQI